MKKRYYVDYNKKQLIFYCEPESTTELNDWYSMCINTTFNEYKKIIDILARINGNVKMLLSYYSAYRKMNSLEKKLGMNRIFMQRGLEYDLIHEEIIEDDNGTAFFSVANFSKRNERIFFDGGENPTTLLCVCDNEIYRKVISNNLYEEKEVLTNTLLIEGSIIVSYKDWACDGNSITVYGKNKDKIQEILLYVNKLNVDFFEK